MADAAGDATESDRVARHADAVGRETGPAPEQKNKNGRIAR
jgi:hypothetical protein